MTDLLGDARRLSPKAQEALRIRAVAAVREGRDGREVAELLGVSLELVTDWWAAWQASEREALVFKTRGWPGASTRCRTPISSSASVRP